MAEGVRGDVFVDSGLLGSGFDGLSEADSTAVVAAGDSTARVFGELNGGKDPLPDPFFVGVGVFSFQGIGEVDATVAFFQVIGVEVLGTLYLFAKGILNALGKKGETVFMAFAIPDEDLRMPKINIFDPQAEAFGDTQAATVNDFGHQLFEAFEEGEKFVDFLLSEDGGERFSSFGADGVDFAQVDVKDFLVEVDESAEGLILGRGGHIFLDGQMSQIVFNLFFTHVAGMHLVVKEDVALDPVQVSFLCTVSIIALAERVFDTIQ